MATYRILSLDGGGIRGLLTIVLIEQLDQRVPGWLDQVDLFAGTSTGGILALGLAKGLTPAELRAFYYDKGQAIFQDSTWDNVRDLGRLVGAEYDNANLRRELEITFGRTRLQDLKRRVVVATFDLDNEARQPEPRCWKPKFFHNFPGPDTDGRRRVVDVALYTSAAPTYFPTVDGYVDGGVVATNPSMAALAQTQDPRSTIPDRPSIDEIRLLSIGAGRVLSRVEGKRKDWGYAQWAKPLIGILLDGTVGVPDYQCRQFLGERYRRLDYSFAPGHAIDLDEWKKRDVLVNIGEKRMSAVLDNAATWLRQLWV